MTGPAGRPDVPVVNIANALTTLRLLLVPVFLYCLLTADGEQVGWRALAGAVFVVASLHLLYINTTLLPTELRPPAWRRAALVTMALFYGFFVTLSVTRLLS